MPQRSRLKVSTVTDGKMFAKKMHRLVKKIQDKPVDSGSLDPLDVLSEVKMARKKGEGIATQIEVETEVQWASLLKREGLIVVDVFSGWSGPCSSMFSILRKLKLDTNDDRLIFATANADNITQLAPFRNQSEPCWLFVGGGKPVKVLRGSNAPKLIKLIKSEFEHELNCIEGTEKRNLISIRFEAGRREKAVSDAINLKELMALEEAEKLAKLAEALKPPTPEPDDDDIFNDEYTTNEEDKLSEIQDAVGDGTENEENEAGQENTIELTQEMKEQIEAALAEKKQLMEESNQRLKNALRLYTVIAIQTYLLETGAVTEIKDRLCEDFELIRERYVNLNDEDARKLFSIPTEIPDPNPPLPEPSPLPNDEENEAGDNPTEDENAAETLEIRRAATPVPTKVEESIMTNQEKGEHENENEEEDEEGRMKEEKLPEIPMIEVTVPEIIIGDTLILLLECTKVKPVVNKEVKNDDDDKAAEGETVEIEAEKDADADYYMILKTGPEDYDTAIETQPDSLHAIYGKEKFVAGVWCPRNYEDKRLVMLNYFPLFVTEMLMPPIPDPPKYHIFVYSALFSSDIMENAEYTDEMQDVVAAKRTRISHKLAEKMLMASRRKGDVLKAIKWTLTGQEVYIISANGRNERLIKILQSYDAIFSTLDEIEAAYFTSKLFPDIEVLIDEDPFPTPPPEEEILDASNPFNFAKLVGKIADVVQGIGQADNEESNNDEENATSRM